MSIDDAAGGGHTITFFPRFDGSAYTLLSSGDLSLWEPVTGTFTDNGGTRTISDPAGAGTRRFYRLEVQRQ